MTPTGTFDIGDALFRISWSKAVPATITDEQRSMFAAVCRVLRRLGFSVGKDLEIWSRHRSISPDYRYARHGALECKLEIHPIGISLTFFQNVVRENRAGGQYDFDRRARMPYQVRLRYEHTALALRDWLNERGFSFVPGRVTSPNPDPLAYFNARWDSPFEVANGRHRFKRDESGWPAESEISSYPGRNDRDGVPLTHGATRHFRTRKGHLMRGRVYGGIGAQWLVVYGPGLQDFTYVGSHELFAGDPSHPRKLAPNREKRLRAELSRHVQAHNYEKAIVIRDILRREFGETVLDNAA